MTALFDAVESDAYYRYMGHIPNTIDTQKSKKLTVATVPERYPDMPRFLQARGYHLESELEGGKVLYAKMKAVE